MLRARERESGSEKGPCRALSVFAVSSAPFCPAEIAFGEFFPLSAKLQPLQINFFRPEEPSTPALHAP